MRLIDADMLKNHYAWWEDEYKGIVDQIVDRQPAVPAVLVVRCWNCEHFDRTNGMCTNFGTPVTKDDYCSYAKEVTS